MTKHVPTFLFTAVLAAAPIISAAAVTGEPQATHVIATVDNTPVTLADLERDRPTALFQARNTFYEAEKKALEEYLEDVLLQRQAKKEGLTVEQLLQKHVNATIAKDPDDSALRVYFEGLDTTEPFEVVKVKIADHLRERRIAKARTAYIQSLRGQTPIVMNLDAPRAFVSLENAPVRGNASAPLKLVEYADYECPYCRQIQPDLDKLEKEFKGRIAFVYKDVPLPNHAHAQKAAEAAHCAGVQNKYWEYHDLIFKASELEVPELKRSARTLGLNGQAFDSCLDSGQQAPVVKAHFDEAQKLGLQGTPSFFLNGRFFSGSMSYDQLRQLVESELKIASAPSRESAGR